MVIEIDKYAGFCFGVTKAIQLAEELSADNNELYCLGQIVHNAEEEERLIKLGMKTISHNDIGKVEGKNMLIRAHGEPPETYEITKKNKVKVIDATCPIVITLQKQIRKKHLESPENQIVIYGKKGHAEVNGLVGQTNSTAIVISNIEEADLLELTKPIFLFSQTTSNYTEYLDIEKFLIEKSIRTLGNTDKLTVYQTICPSVKNRIPRLQKFCIKHDVIIFVSDYKSSNGNMLFKICKENNIKSFFITNPNDLNINWFKGDVSIGISGATSTPLWLMEKVKTTVIELSQL